MKKALTILAALLLPLSVMAMTPVSDEALSDVTGQAGVSINADITMDVVLGTMAWGDATGLDAPWDTTDSDAGGYMGVSDLRMTNLNIKARTEEDGYNGYDPNTMLKPITIDVATGTQYGGNTFVRFGLGSLVISMDGLTTDVVLGPDTASLTQKLGEMSTGDIAVYINPGSYMDIYADGACGVAMRMNVIIDELQLGYVSWGDTDGFADGFWTAGISAGYVGLGNFTIDGPITTVGSVAIDVTTASAGAYASAHGAPVTVVHIAFIEEDFVLHAGALTADVVLAGSADLTSNPGVLGDIYCSGTDLTIRQGSWVDIYAH